MQTEIDRLQEAKRGALKIADERSKENVALRAALHRIIELDHHNHGPESRATTIAREALNSL